MSLTNSFLLSSFNDLFPVRLVLGLLSFVIILLLFIGSTKKTAINCHRARIYNPYDLDNSKRNDVSESDKRRKDSELIDIFEDDIIKRLGAIAMLPVLQHEMV